MHHERETVVRVSLWTQDPIDVGGGLFRKIGDLDTEDDRDPFHLTEVGIVEDKPDVYVEGGQLTFGERATKDFAVNYSRTGGLVTARFANTPELPIMVAVHHQPESHRAMLTLFNGQIGDGLSQTISSKAPFDKQAYMEFRAPQPVPEGVGTPHYLADHFLRIHFAIFENGDTLSDDVLWINQLKSPPVTSIAAPITRGN